MKDIIITDFSVLNLSNLQVPMIVIYNPVVIEHPGMYVARLWEGIDSTPTSFILVAYTYEALINKIPTYRFHKVPRYPRDVPEIREVWL